MTTRFARMRPSLLNKKKVVIPVSKLICVLIMKLNTIEIANNTNIKVLKANVAAQTKQPAKQSATKAQPAKS